MPSSLSTIKEWVADIPNKENQELVQRVVAFMKDTDTSEKYQWWLATIVCLRT
jgi:hypothetical protein